MKVLVTGGAGFIGHALCEQLLSYGNSTVIAVDYLNNYYDVELKKARLATLSPQKRFIFHQLDLRGWEIVEALFADYSFDVVVHLAAQAGVRYSIKNPHAYSENNLQVMTNILEGCRRHPPQHLVFASSSSVYGRNIKVPFSESDNTDEPISFYAATKKANEVMAHSYAYLYQLPITGLRFFTVYGPWGRPDMAPWLFTEAVLKKEAIKVFNRGQLQRDFTYIDDVVEGIIAIMMKVPTGEVPFDIYNIGNNKPIKLMDFIQILELACKCKTIKEYLPMQDGDVLITYADISKIKKAVGFSPKISVAEGIQRFVDWYQLYLG